MKTGKIAVFATGVLVMAMFGTAAYCFLGGADPSRSMGNYRSFSFYADRPGNAAAGWFQPGAAPPNPWDEFWFDNSGNFNLSGGLNIPGSFGIGTQGQLRYSGGNLQYSNDGGNTFTNVGASPFAGWSSGGTGIFQGQAASSPSNPFNEFWFDNSGNFNLSGGLNVSGSLNIGATCTTANSLSQLRALVSTPSGGTGSTDFTGTVYLTAPIKLTANLTLRCDLRPIYGATITTTGYTLTLNGGFEAPRNQCFLGTGTVNFSEPPDLAYPEWFGGGVSASAAVNKSALQYLINAGCTHISFGFGTYSVAAGTTSTVPLYITGQGKSNTTISSDDSDVWLAIGPASPAEGGSFTEITLSSRGTTHDLLDISNCQRFKITHNLFAGGLNQISVSNASFETDVSNNRFYGNNASGAACILSTVVGGGPIIQGNDLAPGNGASAIINNGSYHVVMRNNWFEVAAGSTAVHFFWQKYNSSYGGTFLLSGNSLGLVTTMAGSAILCDGGRGQIVDNQASGGPSGYPVVNISSTCPVISADNQSNRFVIRGNLFDALYDVAIEVDGGDGAPIITENSFYMQTAAWGGSTLAFIAGSSGEPIVKNNVGAASGTWANGYLSAMSGGIFSGNIASNIGGCSGTPKIGTGNVINGTAN